MPDLEQIHSPALDALTERVFDGMGCRDCGIVVLRGAKTWGAHESGMIELPHGNGTLVLRISYDERDAPYAVDDAGNERADLLISLADEGEYLVCAWAQVEEGSPVLGIGVDLASTDDFDERPAQQHFIRLLFCDTEHEIVRAGWPENHPLGYATAFGAKEAAFKSTAKPLRVWYGAHGEDLFYEVRDFALADAHAARGEQRKGAAQRALDAMGIGRIAVEYAEICGMALVVACALR